MSTDYRTVPVEQLVPQSGDMVLLDEILDYGKSHAVSRVRITPASRFFETAHNGIHTSVGIEWMAQTIAATAGIRALESGRAVQIGFLLGTRRYRPTRQYFTNGTEYTVSATQLYREDNGLAAFECRIAEGNETIAESKLNVFAPDNVEKFLAGEIQ